MYKTGVMQSVLKNESHSNIFISVKRIQHSHTTPMTHQYHEPLAILRTIFSVAFGYLYSSRGDGA